MAHHALVPGSFVSIHHDDTFHKKSGSFHVWSSSKVFISYRLHVSGCLQSRFPLSHSVQRFRLPGAVVLHSEDCPQIHLHCRPPGTVVPGPRAIVAHLWHDRLRQHQLPLHGDRVSFHHRCACRRCSDRYNYYQQHVGPAELTRQELGPVNSNTTS